MRLELLLPRLDAGSSAGGGRAVNLDRLAEAARIYETDLGVDGLAVPEAGHDPFLLLAIAAMATQSVSLATNVAVSFPRSPMVTAQAAWDLQNLSHGRFRLGLGTQVRAHNERRFSTPWIGSPVPRMRDYIRCLRAIFASFQEPRAPTYFESENYRFTMLAPFHNPGPINHPHIPIQLAVAGPRMASLAGEACDGCRVHPLATFRYVREVIQPAIEAGATEAKRGLAGFERIGAPFLALARTESELHAAKLALKGEIAHYGTARAYHSILGFHQWEEIGPRLQQLAASRRFADMAECISDEMLEEWAIVSTYDRLGEAIREKCEGLFDTVVLVLPDTASGTPELLREAITSLRT